MMGLIECKHGWDACPECDAPENRIKCATCAGVGSVRVRSPGAGSEEVEPCPTCAPVSAPTDHVVQPHELVSEPTPAAEEDGFEKWVAETYPETLKAAKEEKRRDDPSESKGNIATIQRLRECWNARPFTFHRKGHYPETIPMEQAQERFAKMLDELEAKWIPVEERLPEPNDPNRQISTDPDYSEFVIVLDSYGDFYKAFYCFSRKEWIVTDGDAGRLLEPITHWQPLPTPPQSRQEVKDEN